MIVIFHCYNLLKNAAILSAEYNIGGVENDKSQVVGRLAIIDVLNCRSSSCSSGISFIGSNEFDDCVSDVIMKLLSFKVLQPRLLVMSLM